MKKLVLVALALVAAFNSEAQVKQARLHWQTPSTNLATGKMQLAIDNGQPDGTPSGAPQFELDLPAGFGAIVIKDSRWQAASAKETLALSPDFLPEQMGVYYRSTTVRGQQLTKAIITTVRQGAKGPEKLVEFKYELVAAAAAAPAATTAPKASSVLASGRWHKFSVGSSGLYKLDYASLTAAGMAVNGVNPSHIKVYGNGNIMLPEVNNIPREDDLRENAVWVSGAGDGRFDPGDFLVFYSPGVHARTVDSAARRYGHQLNIYNDNAYVFVTVDASSPGLRISEQPGLPAADQTLSTYDEFAFHETDKVNLLASGREFYGEVFTGNGGQNFNFNVEGGVNSAPAWLTFNLAVAAKVGRDNPANMGLTQFNIGVNGNGLGTVNMPAPSTYIYGAVGNTATQRAELSTLPNGNNLNVRLDYNQGSFRFIQGYLNWIELQYQRQLRLYGGRVEFMSFASVQAPTTGYSLAGANASTHVWDVTQPLNPVRILGQVNGNAYVVNTESNRLRRFAAADPGSLPAPRFEGVVANQNLHGMTVPQMVIIAHPGLLPAANEYAQYRQSKGTSVVVVPVDQIYNEFSSGGQDLVGIRDFCRNLYQRDKNTFEYVMLLGDATYDPRFRATSVGTVLPTWESPESMAILDSYCSDDFIGFLDENEGRWGRFDTPGLDIGIGRVPARNLNEARAIFNKLRAYENSPQTRGRWRNQISFVADNYDGGAHLYDSEAPATRVDNNFKRFITNKIYLSAYPLQYSSQGTASPQANTDVFKSLQEGSLAVFYSGHGSESVWADERVMTFDRLERLSNLGNMPLVVTATCDFGRYDDPASMSGGELVLLKPDGGGVACITTGRKVINVNNRQITQNLVSKLFVIENGLYPTLGDAMMRTKNAAYTTSNDGNRGFALLGDPSMRLAMPQHEVLLTHVNDTLMNANVTASLGALKLVRMRGVVQAHNGSKLGTFNGRITVTVYDKPMQRRISERDPASNVVSTYEYRTYNSNIIYNGTATVRNGDWAVSFVVPKDIDYRSGAARVLFYATDSAGVADANGYSESIIIGGGEDDVDPDVTAPLARLFMNDTTFVNGGLTSPSPLFLARLKDVSGINLSASGIGHEITAVIDGNVKEPIVLNGFYTADNDDYQNGWVSYQFYNLAPGPHTIDFTAWDSHNNSVSRRISFTVVDQQTLSLRQVLTYPNPVSSQGTVMFEHNFEGQDLDVNFELYDLAGKQLKSLNARINNAATRAGANGELTFAAADAAGRPLPEGVYLYVLDVHTSTGQRARQTGKMLVKR